MTSLGKRIIEALTPHAEGEPKSLEDDPIDTVLLKLEIDVKLKGLREDVTYYESYIARMNLQIKFFEDMKLVLKLIEDK